jgi:hypothetical protein
LPTTARLLRRLVERRRPAVSRRVVAYVEPMSLGAIILTGGANTPDERGLQLRELADYEAARSRGSA